MGKQPDNAKRARLAQKERELLDRQRREDEQRTKNDRFRSTFGKKGK